MYLKIFQEIINKFRGNYIFCISLYIKKQFHGKTLILEIFLQHFQEMLELKMVKREKSDLNKLNTR